MKQITVYVQYAYHRYSCSGGKLEQVAGTGRPAMLIFSGNEEGGYTLREFREPKDGSLYAQEIREIFPEDIAAMILDPGSAVVDPEELEARCMVKAQEYVHKLLGLY